MASRWIATVLPAALAALHLLGGCTQHIRSVVPVSTHAAGAVERIAAPANSAPVARATVELRSSGDLAASDHLANATAQTAFGKWDSIKFPMFQQTYELVSDQPHGTTVAAVVEGALESAGIDITESAPRILTVELNRVSFDMTTSELDRKVTIEVDLFVQDAGTSELLHTRRVVAESVIEADPAPKAALDAATIGGGIAGLFGGIGRLFAGGAVATALTTYQVSEANYFEQCMTDTLVRIAQEIRADEELLEALRGTVAIGTGAER